MRRTGSSIAAPRIVSLLTIAAAVAGCASKHDTRGPFVASAPFSKTIPGSGDAVCWSVKRALLGQGYMLERSSETGVLTGTRDSQPTEKMNITVHLQTTCADNRNGTSIVFVTADREVSKLQRMKQTTSAGIGPATITLPAGSAKVLGIVRRETIEDPNFYNSFFALVEGFVAQEGRSHAEKHAEISKQGDQGN
jgi:Uncharacterized protein conserved in bacteria (DUF2242)